MSAVRLFSGAAFISAEFTDISFEGKAVLCFDFYAIRDVFRRIRNVHKGDVPHTSKFKPWKIEVYIAFETEEKAIAFESYLKSGSGHAFAKRHF